jgi:hypothetical protein
MATASTKQTWARGGTVLAATLLLLIGVYQFFIGLAGIAANNFFVVGANYTYEINITAWGWIHLAIGVVAFLAGLALFTGTLWARVVAIAIVAISAIANFFFLPYYPLWSLLLIAIDVFAIWAIASVRQIDEYELTGAATGTGMGADARMRSEQMAGQGQMQSGDRWPADNPAQAGRHWAPENVKEGTGQPTGQPMTGQPMTEEERQRAEAAARGMSPPSNPQGGR